MLNCNNKLVKISNFAKMKCHGNGYMCFSEHIWSSASIFKHDNNFNTDKIMKRLAILTALAAGTIYSASAYEGRLLRFPSTNGNEVVFSYAGDLYKAPINGGVAQHLTSHPGYEMFARFSPDGKEIAFTGQYDGSTEVYVIPADGGTPKRITYTATNSRDNLADRMGPNNVVMGWTPDGKSVVYRNRISDGFSGKLYTISSEGGMPTQIPLPEGGFCCYSPDGKKLAYNRVFREFRTWKYYKGGMADDIWIYDPASAKVENITNNVAQDIFPMWIGDEIFYVSDRDNRMNIFVYNTKNKTTEKVTNFTDYDVKFPSTNGKVIVFENGGYIYRLDPTTRKTSKIEITMNDEGNSARPELRNVQKFASAFDLSPDGSRVLLTARGDVFNVPVKEGVTRNITRTSGAHDRLASWSADGKNAIYISDQTGETELWMKPVDGSGKATQLTKNNDSYIIGFSVSPDGKSVVYSDRKNRLIKLDLASHAKQTLVQDSLYKFSDWNFSPDSRWLTYTRMAKNGMRVIYIYNLETNKEYAVTDNWYDSSVPAFSTDGKYLIFASARDFNPIYSNTEWNHVYTSMDGIYMVMLSAKTPSPFLKKDDKVVVDNKPATTDNTKIGKNKGKADKKQSAEPAINNTTVIDIDGLADRIVKLPLATGNYGNFYCNGKKLWYNNRRDIYVYDFDKKKNEKVGHGFMAVSANGKKALFAHHLTHNVVDFPTTKPTGGSKVNYSNVTATIDYQQEWAQIYDEAWRAYRDGFYLENMHGVDWKAMKDKYAALLPYVKCRQDLSYVIGGLIGELACGHAYVDPGDFKGIDIVKTGLLGAEVSRDKSGYFRIDRILKGATYSSKLFSPLTEQGLNVKDGEFIVAIDGVPTNTVNNIYSLLEGKAGVPTELAINSSASENGARKIVISPIADEYPLYHYEWVQNNIKKVEQASNGKVGYIYIPDMGPEGLNEFCRYYYPQLDKEALIIDDRGNGGGNVSPMLLERLMRKPYRMTMYRDYPGRNEMIPNGTAYGPKVLLVNKYSASDGDLFPWSFKAVKLGTVVGTRTWGGIIGITSSLPYIDGTDIRVPFFTNYDAKTGNWIVENHGVDPDILIDNDPIKEQAGEDQQLMKAVEVALEQLKDYKPLPKTPAPRTLKDLGVK